MIFLSNGLVKVDSGIRRYFIWGLRYTVKFGTLCVGAKDSCAYSSGTVLQCMNLQLR